MEITHELMLDLQRTGVRQTIYAKRGDCLTRTAKIRLFDGGTEFTVPTGTILQIAYAKSDGKGGLYDKMPDKSAACTASGNIVTAKLHPQMFTVAGLVACELRILTGSGEQLSTFTWFIAVQSSATDGTKSEDYYNFATLDGVKQDIGDLSKLNTSVKDSLVAAINSVYATVKHISGRYISGVNGLQRDASGNVTLTGADIETQISAINYHGSIDGAFEIIEKMHGIPIARGFTGDGIAYTATGDDLPTVNAGSYKTHVDPVGKGRQIVYVPTEVNQSNAPTLQINGGEIIPIRMRAPRNQSDDDDSPDATLPVPIGGLMRGVPYTMTFCGKYWLIDSQITQFSDQIARMLTKYANRLIGITDSDAIAVPIINSTDGIDDEIATMFVSRSSEENDSPDERGYMSVPTVSRVSEMIGDNLKNPTKNEQGKVFKVSYEGDPCWSDVIPVVTLDIVSNGAFYTMATTDFPLSSNLKFSDGTRIVFVPPCQNRANATLQINNSAEIPLKLRAYGSDEKTAAVPAGAIKQGIPYILTYTDNCWIVDSHVGAVVPAATASDAGKVLTVDANGAAVWAAVTNAEEVAV